jgi:hypothetical protein
MVYLNRNDRYLGRPNPKPKIDIEFEWVDTPNRIHQQEYIRKSRLKCCPDMESAANISPGPFYFTDKHYPETNGFYECEIDGYYIILIIL